MPDSISIKRYAVDYDKIGGRNPQHVWPLKVETTSSVTGLSSKVFVYHSTMGRDPYQGDSFECVASLQQMTELPEDVPMTLEGKVIPYYRKNICEFNCRSAEEADELWAAVIENVQILVSNYRASKELEVQETVEVL